MADAVLIHGKQFKVDHTPVAAVSAGDIVVLGTKCFIASVDIAAGELGALAAPSGTAMYKVVKAAGGGDTFAEGATVYWNGTTTKATGTDVLGYAYGAAADGDASVNVVHGPVS